MIFSRRDIQVCVDKIRLNIAGDVADGLVKRLNAQGRDRLSAMWEVVIISALSEVGKVESEKLQSNGKRPDIAFSDLNGFEFLADVTCVSDESIEKDNPVEFFQKEFNSAMKRLGMPLGGYSIVIEGKKQVTARGTKTLLKLPEYSKIPAFVRESIEKPIRQQLRETGRAVGLRIDIEEAFLEISFDSSKSPFAFLNYPSYKAPSILDRNPLYSALRNKAKDQLKGLGGVKGIVVCDGDCSAMRGADVYGVGNAYKICNEFFRQHGSVDFVLILSVEEKRVGGILENLPNKIYIKYMTATRNGFCDSEKIYKIFDRMKALIPEPKRTAVNSLGFLKTKGYGLGYKGALHMGGNKVKLSSRVVMDVLSGRRSIEDFNSDFNIGSSWDRSFLELQNPFETKLREGRLPVLVTVEKGDEDDWLEFEFGEVDAAVAPFK